MLKPFAITLIVAGVIGTIGIGIIGVVVGSIVALWSLDPGSTSNADDVLSAFALLVVIFLGAVAAIVAGAGLLKGRRWAYTLAWVAIIALAFAFPIGTAIAAWGLFVLLAPSTKAEMLG